MIRAGAIADRVHFLRHRRQEAERLADPRRRGISDEEWRTQGTLTPEAQQQLAAPAGDRPCGDIPAAQLAAYVLAAAREFPVPRPSYYPVRGTAPATVPMDALPANAAVAPGAPGRDVLRETLRGLQGLDFGVLDAARERHVTYAARGRAPFGDALESGWRPVVTPARRHGEAVAERLAGLYPSCDVTVPVSVTAAAYDAVMRKVDALTGTRGIPAGTRPQPAITSGGAR